MDICDGRVENMKNMQQAQHTVYQRIGFYMIYLTTSFGIKTGNKRYNFAVEKV